MQCANINLFLVGMSDTEVEWNKFSCISFYQAKQETTILKTNAPQIRTLKIVYILFSPLNFVNNLSFHSFPIPFAPVKQRKGFL